jgi:UTP-glucose-1-phosphate uridylyltransferase/galactokinase
MNLFVSGRLCLFGEHSDWAGYYNRTNAEVEPGLAIVTGIEQGIYAYVEKSPQFRFRTVLPNGEQSEWLEWPLSVKRLKTEANAGEYYSYVAGVAAFMMEHYDVGGLSVDCYKVTIPIKKGLSSSAAVCVLIARAFNALYDLQISVRGEMEAAYRGEILTPSRCGRLDQACAYGERPVLMRFAGENIEVDRLNVSKNLYWVFADLKGEKDTKKILSALNACYPFAQNETAAKVQRALGPENRRIVEQVVQAMRDGDAARIGRLMNEAQEIFDTMVAPACPEELHSALLHQVMADRRVRELSLGVKGVGSQGDGTVQMICADEEQQRALCDYLNAKGMDGYSFTIRARHAVRKAVIPIAGFGTRLFPATKVVKKEFFPIIDYDGLMKPALVILLEELERSGIEEIALVIQREEREEFDKLFVKDLRLEHYRRLSKDQRDWYVRIQTIGRKLTYLYQDEQLGFGHAVYQAKGFAGEDPVLLLLGDHLYHTESAKTCSEQLIEAYEHSGLLTVGMDEVPLERVVHYGIVSGTFLDEDECAMQVGEVREKPSTEYAREHLGVKDKRGNTKYYCVFGQYVLTPGVFEALERDVREGREEQGEVQLTPALAEVCRQEGMIACKVEGERFDIGMPGVFRESMQKYGVQK